jgi:hypothetical protein
MLLTNISFGNTVNLFTRCGSADERSDCSCKPVGSSPKSNIFNIEGYDSIRLSSPRLLDQQLVYAKPYIANIYTVQSWKMNSLP